MSVEPISIDNLCLPPVHLWWDQWMLLTSGDLQRGVYNTMTVAMGSIGAIWEMPLAMVVVRPSRYTYDLIDNFETFTLTAFAETYRPMLEYMGTESGRDQDKISRSGLTPVACEKVAAPTFKEAELTIACRKIYWHDIDPTHFLDKAIDKKFPLKDYDRIYFGEILGAWGEPKYNGSCKD
jgi:flavin reductase (DIM6/NTAB) family NADH-FMN oxidoreductase RutF